MVFGDFEGAQTGAAFQEEWVALAGNLVPFVVAFENEALVRNEAATMPLLDLFDELPVVPSAVEALAIRRSSTQFGRHWRIL